MSKSVKKEILASEYSSEQVLAVNTSVFEVTIIENGGVGALLTLKPHSKVIKKHKYLPHNDSVAVSPFQLSRYLLWHKALAHYC